MNTSRRFVLIACVAAFFMLASAIPFAGAQLAKAQGYGYGRRTGGGGYGGGGYRKEGGDSREGKRRDVDKDKDSDSKSGDSKPAANSSGSSDSKPDAAAERAKTKSWAEDTMKENDKDNDHFLKGDEIKALGSSSAKYDLDNDGVITVDELITKASSAASATTATPSAGESIGSNSGGDSDRHRRGDRKGDSESAQRVYTGTAGGLASKSKEGEKRHSYRFSTAADRLPTGLPSFFSRDKNGDGQISMSEYSRTWSKSTVSEFRKYDANDDGIITAKEAVNPASGG